MFCPDCGQELPEGAKFCVACGRASPDRTTTGAAGTQTTVRSPGTVRPTELPRAAPSESEPAASVATPDIQPEFTPAPAAKARVPTPSRRRPTAFIAVLAAVVLVVGIVGYGWSLRAKDAANRPPSNGSPSTSAATGSTSGTTWTGLDPAEVAAAQRAFDQRVADEEREARERAQ